jgi:hypothetical protein
VAPRSQPEWLEDLARLAAGAGFAVQGARACDGVLTLGIVGRSGASLTADVVPLAPGGRYWARTARFGLRHHGGAPSSDQAEALARLARVIRAVEARWPPALAVDDPVVDRAGAPVHFTVETGTAGAMRWTELLLRLTARCNQACPFCSGPPDHPDADPGRLRPWLDEVLPGLERPAVTLTGGEPTLWPGLPDLVRWLLPRKEVVEVRIQTNAVSFARADRVDACPADPRLVLFVSFHAARADLYDACTGSTGQFDLAVAGIRNLLGAGHRLTLNLVANRHNAPHLADFVEAIPALFRGPRLPRLHFSITMCPEHRAEAPAWLVRYGDLSPRLHRAAVRARELGMECDSLLSSTHASIPACLVPEGARARDARGGKGHAVPELRAGETGLDGAMRNWVKAPACERCSQTRWCLGLPRPYAARFGTGELRPIAAASSPTG